MNQTAKKRIILDKSFLQAEGRGSRRLLQLRDAGSVFILTDTLMHEIATDRNRDQWAAAQRKLFPVWDCIECWEHSADLLKSEIARGAPLMTPVYVKGTKFWTNQFRGRSVYFPGNLEEVGHDTTAQREVDTVEALIEDCRSFWEARPKYAKKIHKGDVETVALLRDPTFLDRFARWRVAKDHNDPDDKELYIPGAEGGLGPDWFAYHNARGFVALCCHFISKYGLKNSQGKDFAHTYLDSDYLVLLNYADALATDETSGSLANLIESIHGDSKIVFSTGTFDAAVPSEDETRVEAFLKWEREGRTHGHDLADWMWAKGELLWKRLNSET